VVQETKAEKIQIKSTLVKNVFIAFLLFIDTSQVATVRREPREFEAILGLV